MSRVSRNSEATQLERLGEQALLREITEIRGLLDKGEREVNAPARYLAEARDRLQRLVEALTPTTTVRG